MKDYHAGQRVKIKSTGKEGIVFTYDPDLPYVFNIRLDTGEYITLSREKIEPVSQTK